MPRWVARSTCAPAAALAPPVFQRARAALRYDAQGRRLILPFKHADRTELAAVLAPHMARAGAVLLREADLLVPVPLHRVAAVPAPLQPGGAAGEGGGADRGAAVACPMRWCAGVPRRRSARSRPPSARRRWRARSRCGRSRAAQRERQAGAAGRRCDDVGRHGQCLCRRAACRGCDFGRCSGGGARAGSEVELMGQKQFRDLPPGLRRGRL